MIVVFDTSGVNRLLRDVDSDALIRGVHAVGSIWISTLNLVETTATSNAEQKLKLVRLLKKMTANNEPLDMPGEIVRRAMKAYSSGTGDLTLSVEGENRIAWDVLNQPEDLDDETQQLSLKHLRQQQSEFETVHRSARQHFQDAMNRGVAFPDRVSTTLRAYCGNKQFLHTVVAPIFKKETGADLTPDEVKDLLEHVPELTAFLLGWAHSIFWRAVSKEKYGRNNAGIVDLGFATYIPRITKFVTNDRKQYQALRMIATFFRPRCSVVLYDQFREGLLVNP